MNGWLAELGQLTGEEIYCLAGKLASASLDTAIAARTLRKDSKRVTMMLQAAEEILGVLDDVHAQAARITVPMREAQQIVFRARFARGHPVRMNH